MNYFYEYQDITIKINHIMLLLFIRHQGRQFSFILLLLHGLRSICSNPQIAATVNLTINNWNSTRFVNSPLINVDNKEIFRSNDPYYFAPNYTVLESDLQDEDNVYIFLEKIDDVFFDLYGSKHPNGPCYKISPTKRLIEKCEKTQESCEEIDKCDPTSFQINGNMTTEALPDNILFVTWKKMENNMRQIIVQYKDQFNMCTDSRNILNIKKFVMNSKNSQTVSTTRYDFQITKTPGSSTIENIPFENNLLVFPFAQCWSCRTEFNVQGINCPLRRFITNDSSIDRSFTNNSFAYVWKNIEINGSDIWNNCSLTITTSFTDTSSVIEPFWVITREGYFKPLSKENTKHEDPSKGASFESTILTLCLLLTFFYILM
jgi:hypothetical protein